MCCGQLSNAQDMTTTGIITARQDTHHIVQNNTDRIQTALIDNVTRSRSGQPLDMLMSPGAPEQNKILEVTRSKSNMSDSTKWVHSCTVS